MTEPLLEVPAGGWTVNDLDAFPESNRRYELTDGALVVTQGVEIRFGRQLTRIPDVLVVRGQRPERHWFAPSEVLLTVEVESPGSHLEDRATRPALYAKYGIPQRDR